MLAASPILEISGLSVQFGQGENLVRAVDDVSIAIGPGETVAVVGESGSGKSVTALSVLRLSEMGGGRIAQGAIRFTRKDGEIVDILKLPIDTVREIRGAEISMIFQEPMTSLNPVLKVGEQIAEAIALHLKLSRREARREALRMLQLVRIPDAERILDRYPHQLSGGMRQRVMIAMALSCRPRLLIADEPTTALDVTIQAEILRLIRSLQAEFGMAVLFITHDMGVVAEMADRVVVMRNGRKVEEAPVGSIFHAPQHPYTRALIAAVPRLGSMNGTDAPARFRVFDPEADGSHVPEVLEERATADYAHGPLVSVRRLTTRFDIPEGFLGRVKRRVHAVEAISFDIHPGETLALVGESGCGKSTTGRSILRLVEPNGGAVAFRGQEMAAMDRRTMAGLRQQMQVIFQDPYASLNPRLTVGFSIAEPLITHGLAKGRAVEERVAELLRLVELSPDYARRYPHEFSGGQRQRICIARALASQPSLIVADEAVSALDVSIRASVINLLMDLQERFGLAYLFISHDMAVVERISHRVAVMYLGQIVELGSRRDVFERPAHPYTRKLLSAVPVADPAQRRTDIVLTTTDIPSPIRKVGDEPPIVPLREIAPGHFVAENVPMAA